MCNENLKQGFIEVTVESISKFKFIRFIKNGNLHRT